MNSHPVIDRRDPAGPDTDSLRARPRHAEHTRDSLLDKLDATCLEMRPEWF